MISEVKLSFSPKYLSLKTILNSILKNFFLHCISQIFWSKIETHAICELSDWASFPGNDRSFMRNEHGTERKLVEKTLKPGTRSKSEHIINQERTGAFERGEGLR